MRNISLCFLTLFISNALVLEAYAKDEVTPDPEFDQLLSQDISDLTVTSVAKREQRLSDTAAAVYVITQEDIRRAGIYSIPEALRLVPGMQVAKLSSDTWAVSARGFNGALDNKLLVLIDGRAIYTPVFSGTYWGDESTSINDIDRIEVIRGPGATIYGANAVNGVVNIITKSAEDTQGNLLSATANQDGNGVYEARHGGKLSDDTYYRAYTQYNDSTNMNRERAGFRVDGKARDNDSYTVQGDAYGGTQDKTGAFGMPTSPFISAMRTTDDVSGGNITTHWNHKISSTSDVSVIAYVDNYSRNELLSDQHVTTGDVEMQNSIKLNDRNNFIWGGGARMSYEELIGSFTVNVNDRYATHSTLSTFAQDEYALVPDKLYLTVGSKFEYNDYTGLEVEPSTRLAWHPTSNQTVWGAVSRAVRTPSSIEEDVNIATNITAGPPVTETRIIGNPEQESEELVAYELGHRIQITPNLSFDSALYLNQFDRLQTLVQGATYIGTDGNTILPYQVNNLGSGHVYGAEFSSSWNVNGKWKLAGSYSYMKMLLDAGPGALSLQSTEALAPRNQFSIQSYYNVTDALHFDNMIYYVSNITEPVNTYVRYDTRLAYLVQPGLELSLIGRNLLDPHHPEFPTDPQTEVDRSFIGQVLWKF